MTHRVGEQLGNYRLTRLLGQGGFAEVHLAEHVHLRTQVAIKLLYGKLTAQDVQAFIYEAQTLAALRHPHILRVLDFGFAQTLPFLVMDYAPAGTLRDRHAPGSLVPLPSVIFYIRQIASALAYAHTNKLIHRDVKPENMLLNDDGSILLSDFGIVAAAHSTASMKTIDATGTVHYMAPEQIKGQPRTASDQYALAIVAYEWLCGERPFTGNTSIEIAMRQLSDVPPSLCERLPSLPSSVEQVIFKALAKDPQHRFPDILTFSSILEQAGQTPQNPGYSAQKIRTQQEFLAPSPQPSLPPPIPGYAAKTAIHSKFSDEEEEIIATYDQALADVDSPSSKTDLFQKKIAFLKQLGRFEDALAVCNQALAEDLYPHHKLTLIKQKADFLKQLGRYDEEEIIASYDRALAEVESASGKTDLFQGKIAFLKQLGRFEDALAVCNQALAEDLYPHHKLTLIKQKTAFLKQLGYYKKEEIIASYDRALADIESASSKTDLFQGKIAFLKQLGHYEDALAVCNQALAEDLYPHHKLTLIKQKADFLKQLGRYDEEEIIASYDRALAEVQTASSKTDLFQGKIAFLKQLGRFEDAFAVCNQALAEDLYSHHKLTLIEQKADFLKRLRGY